MLWLRNLKNCPPGEFWYRQSEAGAKTFGPSPLIGQVAGLVSEFRKGNGLPRSDQQACLEDVILFTIQRLGPDTEWTMETEQPASALLPQPGGSCAGCGAVVS